MNTDLTLLTALGHNPGLIWELVDFFNAGDAPAYNPAAARVRGVFAGRRLGRLVLLCTAGVMTTARHLTDELVREYPDLQVEPVELACEDICCATDDTDMARLVTETVARLAGPHLVVSSGGRKTVTQRLIEAAILHGCAGYLTITAPAEVERRVKDRDSARAPDNSRQYNVIWTPAAQFYKDKRRRVIKDEIGDTFRSLYLLPTSLVQRLRSQAIGADHARETADLEWLRRLPKTDLHCHLGGAYDPKLLKELAATLLHDLGISGGQRRTIQDALENSLGRPLAELTPEALRRLHPGAVHCLANLETLYQGIDAERHLTHAVLVAGLDVSAIEQLAADGGRRPPAGRGLDWYMKSGDLGGSNLLQTENTLRRAVSWLIATAAADGVRYLEIRFSPGNYTRAGLTIDRVVEIVRHEAGEAANTAGITANLLIMATRHKEEAKMAAHIAAAVRAVGRTGPCRVAGFDLAGQEEENPPERFTTLFDPLHKHFIDVTIHAGEMDTEDKIWQALYRLHAKRIGHGLKLERNSQMMDYVRDWGIAVEMCPSSNRATNGFRRFDREEEGPEYPLKKYLDHGIRVTVNTDNPGISRTTASRELLMAGRLTAGGLSRWDVLRLVRHGFKAAFLPRDEKDRLLKEVDHTIFTLLLEEI